MQLFNWLVIKSKLIPPRPPRQSLDRSRITTKLLRAVDYRATILQAGAGYGKSTALAALVKEDVNLVWYHLGIDDADSLRFLIHLVHGFQYALPAMSQVPLALLEQWDRAHPWTAIIDALTNELTAEEAPVFLIIDDAHLMNEALEIRDMILRLVNHAPPSLHLILSTRYKLPINEIVSWRLHGELLEVGRDDLAFTAEEICQLYAQEYTFPLTQEQCQLLAAKTDGWPMVMPLVRELLQRGSAKTIDLALEQLSGSAGDLFTYLAQEFLAQQSEDVQKFLRETAVLPYLSSGLCDCIRNSVDSATILSHLEEQGFCIVSADRATMRYHHLFRNLLLSHLSVEERKAYHAQAAICCQGRDRIDEAIYHFIEASQFDEAAKLLVENGRLLINRGNLDTLEDWIGSLPPEKLTQYPVLLIYLGDVARLRSQFGQALAWYQEAEAHYRSLRDMPGLGQALRGQARIYLDTVNPTKAEKLLEEALKISDGQHDRESRLRLLDLLAENRLNQGRASDAERLRRQAQSLREQERDIGTFAQRLMLRSGQIIEARQTLEKMVLDEEEKPVSRPRAHRETTLLLSIIYAFLGERDHAYRMALAGTERGHTLNSPFITAVGWMRQGHSWLLLKNRHGYDQAKKAFQEAINISDQLRADRLKAEAYWGLCQAYGFRGQLDAAERFAQNGLILAQQAGDEWIVANIHVSLAAGFLLIQDYPKAASFLDDALISFHACGDTHGETIVRLWQCLLWQALGDQTRLLRDIDELLRLVAAHDYGFLFLNKTLLGPPDPRMLVPLLIFGRENSANSAEATVLLNQFGLSRIERHPGYQLRMQALGPFRIWRGNEELGGKVWERKKARQLFMLFLTYYRSQLHRDQIVETLWPGSDPQNGSRAFKVAFNALLRVLEPDRPRNAPSSFILREGSRYGLNPDADMVYDVIQFDELIVEGDRLLLSNPQTARENYRKALSLYQGDYLQEFPYEEWSSQERRRLRNRYLRTAERLARSLLQANEWPEAIDAGQLILAVDNCWEPAYMILMNAYANLGNRTQVIRTYQLCQENLMGELGVEPTEVTQQTYETSMR